MIIRAELRRLFRWIKEHRLTAVITGEKGGGTLTRYGLEEYVADCVILLDHRVQHQITTRRLRIVKYRGSVHGTNEYPFLITGHGLSVLPITSLDMNYPVSDELISSGIKSLDALMEGGGFYRGSSILVSGPPGTGKSSVGMHLLDAACRRGERTLYLAYEESANQILRNMRSIGFQLERWVKRGRLHVHSARPALYGLERHLVDIHEMVETINPSVVLMDPMGNLSITNDPFELSATLTRLIDFLKHRGITAMFTLVEGFDEHSQSDVSSLMDTWLTVQNLAINGERRRSLYVLKSRGMAHSNRVHELEITRRGVRVKESKNLNPQP
jgi:circadian clock protein KaiC